MLSSAEAQEHLESLYRRTTLVKNAVKDAFQCACRAVRFEELIEMRVLLLVLQAIPIIIIASWGRQVDRGGWVSGPPLEVSL